MTSQTLHKLCSKGKLDRDHGFAELQAYLIENQEEEIIENVQHDLISLFPSSLGWENRHGAIRGAIAILEHRKMTGRPDDAFASTMAEKALEVLDDDEFRVRIAAGEILGLLCSILGPEVYANHKDKILDGIRSHLERHGLQDDSFSPQDSNDHPASILAGSPNTSSTLIERRSSSSSQMLHDTAGWKSLETYMKCLQSITLGCGYSFNQFIDQELLDLIFETLVHTNRFVRETGFYVCGALVTCGTNPEGSSHSDTSLTEENAIYRHGFLFSEHLSTGISDNWSQVRMAASVATRKFLINLPSEKAREKFYPVLIPPMCLNRYYIADGVRIYSQATWEMITQGEGKVLVENYIDKVVDCYVKATESDNHAVREAACACIAELGSKIDKTFVSPHVGRLLQTLLVCFHDDSWPVRDAACIASGHFVLCFSDESRSTLPALYPLFFDNLQDNIASVRQGAAAAITNVIKAYGGEEQGTVFDKIKEGFEHIKDQPAESQKYAGLDKGPSTYGVVKHLRDNDVSLHSNQQMYSCGSLAPKMGRGGGCMDHQFRKPSEPWELADGCVHLLSELSHIPSVNAQVGKMIPAMAKACNSKDYVHYPNFLETICKQIPHIAKGLGKRSFKMYLELFLEHIFEALDSKVALTSVAASQCLVELSLFLGPGIMRGRVENFNTMYLNKYDAIPGIPSA